MSQIIYIIYIFYYFYFFHKFLALKAGQLNQARNPGGSLTQAANQPYGLFFLTGHVFKEKQRGNVNNIKMMSSNISSP